MTLMGLVKSFHGLVIARIFLGLAEAGLFPVSSRLTTQILLTTGFAKPC